MRAQSSQISVQSAPLLLPSLPLPLSLTAVCDSLLRLLASFTPSTLAPGSAATVIASFPLSCCCLYAVCGPLTAVRPFPACSDDLPLAPPGVLKAVIEMLVDAAALRDVAVTWPFSLSVKSECCERDASILENSQTGRAKSKEVPMSKDPVRRMSTSPNAEKLNTGFGA